MRHSCFVLKRFSIVALSVALVRCGSSGINPVGSTDTPGSTPTVTPTATATATAAATPSPSPTPTSKQPDDGGNGSKTPTPSATVSPTPEPGAPTVSVKTSTTSCHPVKDPSNGAVTGCPATFTAVATGGKAPLSYSWSGICTGTAASVVANITALGDNYCTVVVTDALNRAATANSPSVVGTNSPLVCSTSGGGNCHPSGSSPFTCTTSVAANCSDPDGDPILVSWSGCASGSGKTSTCTLTKIGANTAKATGSDGWTTASSTVDSTGTDTPPTHHYDIGPYYHGGAYTEIPFSFDDAENDPLTNCTATCTDPYGGVCCTIVNCRTDLYDGQPGHILYKNATVGSSCSMHLKACNKWACYTDNQAFSN